jgi:hypothetical protein
MLIRLDQTLMWQMKLIICNQIKCFMMIKIISFSKKLLCELNVEYIVEIYVTIKLIHDF